MVWVWRKQTHDKWRGKKLLSIIGRDVLLIVQVWNDQNMIYPFDIAYCIFRFPLSALYLLSNLCFAVNITAVHWIIKLAIFLFVFFWNFYKFVISYEGEFSYVSGKFSQYVVTTMLCPLTVLILILNYEFYQGFSCMTIKKKYIYRYFFSSIFKQFFLLLSFYKY